LGDPRGAFCAAVPKLSNLTIATRAGSAVPKLTKVYVGLAKRTGFCSQVYYNTNLIGCQEKFEKTYPQDFHRKNTRYSLTPHHKILIIIHMKNENKRPTKKALVKMLEERGVEKEIVASLQRANIDTLIWVLNKIS
jgi:hypothetical protein